MIADPESALPPSGAPKPIDYGMPVHPVAELFPMMNGEDLDALATDIRRNGQQVPCVKWKGMLLDGRNRIRACRAAHVQPVFVEWAPTGLVSASEYIVSLNLNRRQLTPDQFAAAITATDHYILREKAEARKAATAFEPGVSGNPIGKAKEQVNTVSCSPAVATSSERDTREMHANSTVGQIAAKAGVSFHKARQAVAVQKAAPELMPKVISGEMKLREAVKTLPKKTPTPGSVSAHVQPFDPNKELAKIISKIVDATHLSRIESVIRIFMDAIGRLEARKSDPEQVQIVATTEVPRE